LGRQRATSCLGQAVSTRRLRRGEARCQVPSSSRCRLRPGGRPPAGHPHRAATGRGPVRRCGARPPVGPGSFPGNGRRNSPGHQTGPLLPGPSMVPAAGWRGRRSSTCAGSFVPDPRCNGSRPVPPVGLDFGRRT
jgi:hypothetical protein